MTKDNIKEVLLNWTTINQVFKKDEKNIQENQKRDFKRYTLDSEILNKNIDKNKLLIENEKERLEYIYFISTLINSFYSTRMGASRVYQVAEAINKKGPININDTNNIIETINDLTIYYETNNKEKHYRPYSFLSKFFSLHGGRNLPIYDSRIENTIKLIINKSKENTELYSQNFINKIKPYKNADLKDYKKFKEIVDLIRNEIGPNKNENNENISYSKLDQYFWLLWESEI